ncbi:MAG TPA: cytochrome c3 family protein [Kofleriaceae bacterium]
MFNRFVAWAVCSFLVVSSCTEAPEGAGEIAQPISFGAFPPPGATTSDTPIGIALDLEDGVGVPLKIRSQQKFYIQQIDVRAHVDRTVDEGVAGLAQVGDFAGLDWSGTRFVDESFVSVPNADGTFTRRRMFRKARWMDERSKFVIEQLDASGERVGTPLVTDTGREYRRTDTDSFFVRRLRAIQWTNNCASGSDCSHATSFMEEALVELRYASGSNPNVALDASTTQLRVTWSANPNHRYTIPVVQVVNPMWDYGFAIDLAAATPPGPGGFYTPGQVIDVKFTLRDGAGTPLHPPGQLPTFLDYLTGNDPSGIDYWNVNEKVMTYYRRKHMEKQMVIAIDGPLQDTQPVRDTLDFVGEIATSTDGAVTTARPEVQGFFGEAAAVPAWPTLIGLQPIDSPVGDTARFTLPPNAASGTYKIVMKARRSYLGQELPASKTIEIQVGTAQPTTAHLDTGPCTSCHRAGSDLTRVSHAISPDNRDTCTTCHVPLPFEPEGPLYVRTHFVHSRTDRLNALLIDCSNCHTGRAGIQRTSKSACLSCHKRYPPDHIAKFGPVVDMYIGGTLEDSFQQCTAKCHTNHPASGL